MRNALKTRGALFALVFAFALIAAACSSDDGGGDTTTTTAASQETTTTTTAAPLPGEGIQVGMAYDIGGRGDKSFNDSAAEGLDRATADFGITSQELEPTAGGENREENLRLLAESGFNPVFAIGFAFAEAVTAAAVDFPDTTFVIVDSVVEAPNVASMVFTEHEGSALVGAVAALKTETGIIGFIGGVNIGLINRFEGGYIFGAEQIDPDIEVISTYLTEPPDFSGFADPAKGKEAALAMFDQGADIVYHAAGGSGQGLFEAAKDVTAASGSKVWGIGVDADQFQTVGDELAEFVMTSMLKRVDVAVYSTISSFIDGTVATSQVRVFDLAADGSGYTTSGGFIDDINDQIQELRAKIVSGELVVPDLIGG